MYADEHMSFDVFKGIVDSIQRSPVCEINLTGEGEPLLHPNIWEFVHYVKTKTPHRVSFTTNASALTQRHIQNVVSSLDSIRISLDTMDASVAEQVGRHDHARVIRNIEALALVYDKITIMTTKFGQDVSGVNEFVKTHKFNHKVQPLQRKSDYASAYTQFSVPVTVYPQQNNGLGCKYAETGGVVTYNVRGVKMPCVFIKDTSYYPGYDSLIQILSTTTHTPIPHSCMGCVNLIIKR